MKENKKGNHENKIRRTWVVFLCVLVLMDELDEIRGVERYL